MFGRAPRGAAGCWVTFFVVTTSSIIAAATEVAHIKKAPSGAGGAWGKEFANALAQLTLHRPAKAGHGLAD
jgi:hypothetical protein